MKTRQAHSLGRDAALRRPRNLYRRTAQRAVPTEASGAVAVVRRVRGWIERSAARYVLRSGSHRAAERAIHQAAAAFAARTDATPRRRVLSTGYTNLRTAQRAVPTTWLNLACLDAPLVAIAWLGLFARTFHCPFQTGNAVALFLTAWLIYLADRFADANSLKPGVPRSLRQEFCLRHREIWIVTVALVAGFDAYVIWRTTASQTLLVGSIVGLLAVLYLVLNHPLGSIWGTLPAKELAIGNLFAAGTVVALLPHLPVTRSFAIAVIAFAALCSLNCISIAAWERELDRAQRKVSVGTLHPRVARYSGTLCLGLSLAAFALAIVWRAAAPIFVCLGISGLLLTWLNASSDIKEGRFEIAPALSNRRSLGPDERTALGDLVLLTPVVALVAMAL